MIKVLVADDEISVCKLICNLVDWKMLGMELSGTANNGIEALEMISTCNPDIIITDIRMPGYDGLELIDRAKQLDPNIEFIIISGYRHFDYARSAIKFGVSDYLLKPINKAELEDTLLRIKERYQIRTSRLSEEQMISLRRQNDAQQLRTNFIFSLINREKNLPVLLEQINETFHFQFREGKFQVACMALDSENDDWSPEGTDVIKNKISKTLKNSLQKKVYDMEIAEDNNVIHCLINFPIEETGIYQSLKIAMDDLLPQILVFGNVSLTAGLGFCVENTLDFSAAMESARFALQERLISGTGGVLEMSTDSKIEFVEVEPLLTVFRKNIEAAVEILRPEDVANACKEFHSTLMTKRGITGEYLYRACLQACEFFYFILKTKGFDTENSNEGFKLFSKKAQRCSNANRLFDLLLNELTSALEETILHKAQIDKKPIRVAKQYIQKNYMKPITLDEVSTEAGFCSAYFSSLFKRESGQNFVEYLSEVRMNKAKELLRETSLNISVVCEQVGYSDLRHFTRGFKKVTGLNPSEFRKLYS